jgi:4-azaleucine resistance transporter AzlC
MSPFPVATGVTTREDFVNGMKTISPVLLGIAPFALVSGVAAVNVGLSPLQAAGMSVLIFAGTSQLAAIDLIGQGAAAPVVVLTVVIINVRLVMYSASLAPSFRGLPVRWLGLLSYVMTDHVYAIAIATFDGDRSVSRKWYYLGLAVPVWVVWQISTVVGIALGTTVPDHWGLEFVIPLTFLAILVPELKDRSSVAVAVLAGVLAVTGAGLPMNLGLVGAATAGVLFGTGLDEVRSA